jgi:hypothetical protein
MAHAAKESSKKLLGAAGQSLLAGKRKDFERRWAFIWHQLV